MIAEANALDGDGDLVAGATLTVPEVKTSSNDASTFKPYNPGEITGPTSPGLPYIAPPSSAGCNPVMMILMAVVTIVVAVYAPVLAPSLSNVFGGAVIGGTGAFAGATVGGAIAASAVVGAGASAVAQGVGSVLGATSFSWRQVALDGLMAGATAGMANTSAIGNIANKLGGSAFARGAVSSVAANLTSQAAQRLIGMETHFSWKSIAASAVSGGIAQVVTPTLTAGIRTEEGVQAASGVIGGVIGLHTRRAFGFDDPINYGAIMADAFGNMLAQSLVRGMSATGTASTGDRAVDKLQAINADLRAKLEAKTSALVDGSLDTRLARQQSDMTFPEWQITGSGRTGSTVIRTVAPSLRYQTADGQLWADIPKVRYSTDFKDLTTGLITNVIPDVMVVRDARTSQHFMQQWEHAYRHNLPAPTQASWGYLESRRQALDDILRPAYNAYANDRIAFTKAQMPQQVVQRYMTNAEFSAWRKQDNLSFLKFMGGTALMGVLPAVATASPLVGAAMSGWSIGSGVNSFREGNYVQGSLEVAGGLLGLGVAGVQIKAATTVKQAVYMPLGPNGTAGALSAEVRTWEDLGVRSLQAGDAAPSTTINVANSAALSQTAMRERVLANIAESQSARSASNMGGGLVTDAVAIPDHTLRRLLQERGLPSSIISEVRASFDGPVFARHGFQGDQLLIAETATGRASGIYVTRGSAGATPDIRKQVLALPPSNLALVENPVFLARPQTLLEGLVAPQPIFGSYATGGGWQVVTDGGFRTGALNRGW